MAQTHLPSSFLERLFDERPSSPADHLIRGWSLDQLKDSVARDIEALLNSRCSWPAERLTDYDQACRSVLSYGMADFAGLSLANPDDRARVCRSIAEAIANHEPRLQVVQVLFMHDDGMPQKLHFSIQALLMAGPVSEPVSFNALLQPATQQYVVSRMRHGPGMSWASLADG